MAHEHWRTCQQLSLQIVISYEFGKPEFEVKNLFKNGHLIKVATSLLSIFHLISLQNKVIGIEKAIETEVKKDVGIVAEKTHMPPW